MYVIHVDGDSFFASVEQAINPGLKGKPVVTGKERGIASAMSMEAKRLGVIRGMPVRHIREWFPAAVIVSSDYWLYSVFSRRMVAIARRYCKEVFEYSIDEFFAYRTEEDIDSVAEVAKSIKHEIRNELGITVSVGVTRTMVLSKIASNRGKPDGCTVIPRDDVARCLGETPIAAIWGLGPRTAERLVRYGLNSALDLAGQSRQWIEENTAKPVHDLWYELNGHSVLTPSLKKDRKRRSLRSSRTFTPTDDRSFIRAELSSHLETGCARLRGLGLSAGRVGIFLKTSSFRYHDSEMRLFRPSGSPSEIMGAVSALFDECVRSGFRYRAVGVVLSDLVGSGGVQDSLLLAPEDTGGQAVLDGVVDDLNRRFGSNTVRLCSSMRGDRLIRSRRRRLSLPSLGEV